MNSKHGAFFRMIEQAEPPAGLEGRIMARIALARARALALQHLFFGATALLSGIGGIFALNYALVAFSQSAFYQYASLLFTDTGAVLAYWQQFSLSLIEAVPVVGLTLFVAAAFAFVGSLQLFAGKVRFSLTRFA